MIVSGEHALLLWIAVCAVMVLGGLVHGALGLGFPLVTTPLLATMMDVRAAILVTLLPTAAVNLVSLFRGGGWGLIVNRYWPFAACAVLGTWISTKVLIVSSPEPFRLLLAVIVLLYLWASRRHESSIPWVSNKPLAAMLVFGLLAGLSAGTTNVMVPILIIYALEAGLAAAVMVQVFNFCFLTGKATQFVVFGANDLITMDLIWQTLPLAALATVVLLLGMKIRARLNADTYKGLVRTLLAVLAILLLIQFGSYVMTR